ncbi:hypothetical protein ACHAXT_005145 [Thalassiosira profunda]
MASSSLAGRCLRLDVVARGGGVQTLCISRAQNPMRAPALPSRRLATADAAVAATNATAATAAATPATANQGGTAGKIFFTSLCAATFGLGAWQTQRYFEKVKLVKKREDDLGMEPLSSYNDWRALKSAAGSDGGAKSYQRVHLRGKFQHENEILIGPRGPPPGALADSGPNSGRGGGGGMSSSAQGYYVVTPFVVSCDGAGDPVSSDANAKNANPRRGWFDGLFGRKNDTSGNNISSNSSAAFDNCKDQAIVWINRGWIPRHYINKNNERVASWEQPRGSVDLMAMESRTESPGTFTPPSRLDSKKSNESNPQTINKLLWIDRSAMEEMTSCPADSHPPLFVEINGGGALQYPAKPPRECVGEFKVTPEVHAGYAATWFGLSGAGMVMTRKLLTKGR